MTAGSDGVAREDEVLTGLFPALTENLAAQYADDYDTETGHARFLAWIAANSEDEAEPGEGSMPEPRQYQAEIMMKLGPSLIDEARSARQERTRSRHRILEADHSEMLQSERRLRLAELQVEMRIEEERGTQLAEQRAGLPEDEWDRLAELHRARTAQLMYEVRRCLYLLENKPEM
jgi:hypothetical protein